LVSLTVPVGEPGSVSQFRNPLAPAFTPGGLPTCSADLEVGAALCVGLVPNSSYEITDGSQHVSGSADSTGALEVPLAVRRGDSISISNGARVLTTLHVGHLRVAILGDHGTLAGGTCQPGDYFGQPPSTVNPGSSAGAPTSAATGGLALTGRVCPSDGDATGLSATDISQTDDRSGGQTQTEVPDLYSISPVDGETVYGTFTAVARSGLGIPGNEIIPTDGLTRVSLILTTAGSGPIVFEARNVDVPRGVAVPALAPGQYLAIWTVTNANGDRRILATRFIARPGRPGPAPKMTLACGHAGADRIHCLVAFPRHGRLHGKVKVRLARGGVLVAAGDGRVRGGRAAVDLNVRRTVPSGDWEATVVLIQPHLQPVRIRKRLPQVA
jgi:hypothetical protein